jgi:hypothetical protein
MLQCAVCKRTYKHATNYNKHVTICELVNSQAIKNSASSDTIYSDHEAIETQAPSNARLFEVVRHLVGVVNRLQSKVTNLEQMAHLRKPKPDVRAALRARKPCKSFRDWVSNDIVSQITRATLIDRVFCHSSANLADAMCKIILAQMMVQEQQSQQGQQGQGPSTIQPIPLYANETKTGSFMMYDDSASASAAVITDADIDTDTTNPDTAANYWRALTLDEFRWMINAVHKRLLSEYHTWTIDANDNSDAFIETSMRFGAIILGGNMEWSTFMTKLNSKMWGIMTEYQTSAISHQ